MRVGESMTLNKFALPPEFWFSSAIPGWKSVHSLPYCVVNLCTHFEGIDKVNPKLCHVDIVEDGNEVPELHFI